MSSLVVPFAFKLPDETSIAGTSVVVVGRTALRGLARVRAGRLVLEWAGAVPTVTLTKDGRALMGDRPVPYRAVGLPLAALAALELAGWWRPRIELCALDLRTFNGIPGAAGGRLALWVDRRDRERARALVAEAWLEIADALLRAAEEAAELPERGVP
jgi:hypothetical protein